MESIVYDVYPDSERWDIGENKKVATFLYREHAKEFGKKYWGDSFIIKENKIMNTDKDITSLSKLPIYCVSENFLEFEEWYELFEDFINIEIAETDADREMDFDSEYEFDRRYEMYLNAR